MSQSAMVAVPVNTLCRITQSLAFFSDWTVPELKSVASCCQTLKCTSPTRIIKLNGLEPYAYFLVKGSVTLETARGDVRTIHANDADAGYPIAHIRPSPYEVIAAQGSELLRIEGSKLRSHQAQHKPARLFAEEEVIGLLPSF